MEHVRLAGIAGGAMLFTLGVGGGGCSSTSSTEPPPAVCKIDSPAPQDDFCNTLAIYDGRCNHCQDCVGRNLQNCQKRSASLSAAHRAAFIACKESLECIDDPSQSACVRQQMKSATPTAAQIQAKDAYCAACPGAECDRFFQVGNSIGEGGAGYNVLLGSDHVAGRAVMLCSMKCKAFDYAICVGLIECAEAGGDFCVDSGFCAPQ